MTDKHPLSARYPDLLSEHDDPALLKLVEDLDTLYTSHTLPARLVRPAEEGFFNDEQQEPAAPVSRPEQPGVLTSFTPKRHTRWPRLSALAAVVFTVLLVGALIGTFTLARPHTGPTTQGTGSQAVVCHVAHASPQPLEDIHMMTATTGWAISWRINGPDSFELVHTVDGGCHWKIVSPVNHGSLYSFHYYYISGTAAWLELIDGTKAYFARTTDGGATWQFAPSPGGIFSLPTLPNGPIVTFLTPEIGWLIAGKRSGEVTEATLYHTTDGGLTWQKLTQMPADFVSGNQLTGTYTGMSFLNQSTGWVAGESSNLWLYVTHDGGRSWQKQELPINSLPPNVQTNQQNFIVTRPPQFFSPRDGLLTVTFTPRFTALIYATHDGGATWQPEHPLSIAPIVPSTFLAGPSFLDMSFGWLWTNDDKLPRPTNTLFITHNGGQSWRQTRLSLPASLSVEQITFVSSDVGWLISSKPSAKTDAAKLPTLFYRTVDGGKTWTQINYTVA